jgi:hypothetical protein
MTDDCIWYLALVFFSRWHTYQSLEHCPWRPAFQIKISCDATSYGSFSTLTFPPSLETTST